MQHIVGEQFDLLGNTLTSFLGLGIEDLHPSHVYVQYICS